MGFFGKSTSKQTAKLKSLIKHAVARLVVVRRPCLARWSIARGDVGKLLAIDHLERALRRAEWVIDEDNMLKVLEIIERYCKILIEQAAQLEKPKECSEEVKKAVAGLMFASARCGKLPELLYARAILVDKFGPDFARAAKEGSHGVVDPTLVRKLSGEMASTEQKRRLAKEIAAENILPGATEQETKPSWKPLKSSSPSPSWSDRGTVSSVGSEAAQKGKGIVFNQSDEEEDEVVEDVIGTPQLRRPPYRRTASTMGIGGGSTWHGVVGKVGADPRPFQDVVPDNSNHARPPHRRHASKLAGGNAHALHEALDQRGQYKNPPYRRNPTAKADSNGDAARREELDGRRPRHQDSGAYESSAYVHPPYASTSRGTRRSAGSAPTRGCSRRGCTAPRPAPTDREAGR